MYQPTWLDTKITANLKPSVTSLSIEAKPIANKSVITNPTAVKVTEDELAAIELSVIKEWSAIKLFYRRYMPYARLAQKEAVAVIHHLDSTAKNSRDDISRDINNGSNDVNEAEYRQLKIIAAIRVKPIGRYQLVNGLLVHPDYRGLQLSIQLLQFIAPTLKVKHCFLFAHPWLIGLYQQQHFVVIDNEALLALPAEITQLYYRYHSEERPLVLMQLTNPEQ
ncbi:GNAT family N-acetyltransferase [Shewanella livingstonensis]|uniref:N-acetyltransferase n=1 Tax=Shewanella livingstonensis TaxID=150120 RepID=A0A3G8LZG5_9GAMM|nr:GNAT family N-acetyltransferase [Shewanella livingstonensis]AZG74535.1 N-acetyltransferase [Shewanella livingstonensis]